MTTFLDDYVPRRVTLTLPEGLTLRGLHLGQGNLGLEVLVLDAATEPKVTALRQVWKDRLGGRAAPLLAIALHGDTAVICGPAGENPPIRRIEAKQAERLCIRALAEPDRNAALRFLHDALPSLETELPGIRNEGLLSDHELARGARLRTDWTAAQTRAAPVLGAVGMDLLRRLGFGVEKADGVTSLLRTGSRDRAVAVLLDGGETPEGAAPRFQNLSPVSWALAMADQRNLPWVVVVQGDRVRLYPVELGVGVGRRGRTETWIELRTGLMRQDQAALLWLIFSADALKPSGTLEELLENSKRFAADLAVRLRERIYDRVIPGLATGIARARGLRAFSAEDLRLTYGMALTVLFRLLFIAYAEDRDLLPFSGNEAYRRRALKTKAQELATTTAAPGPGAHLWQEVTRLFDAVREGDAALGVPAYGGGLFETDPAISKPGAALAGIALPDAVFEPVLRGLLLDDKRDLARPDGIGPVDFRSLRVREFGTIYEGLLESELAVADADLALKKQGKDLVYVPAKARDAVAVPHGGIYLHNRSGARKSSGSYFTPSFAVDHELDTAVEPVLAAHAERLMALDDTDAAEAFFDIRVADIAMGSGHFLVAAVDRIERALSAILADPKRKLPGVTAELAKLRTAAETELKKLGLEGTQQIEDGQLLRRLIARRCIYGVDLNPLAVELARLSIWIHTFVPGLPLSLLDHRLVEGNALVGVATLEDAKAKLTALAGVGLAVEPAEMIAAADAHLARLGRNADTTPDDVAEAREAYRAAKDAVAAAVSLFDAAVAAASGHTQFRVRVNRILAEQALAGITLDLRNTPEHVEISAALAAAKPLHLPAAFPEVFRRQNSGFDAIIGNPPWEKLRVEKHEFWARHFPGLRGIKSTEDRDAQIGKLERARPDLVTLEATERLESEALRNAMRALPGMNTGHPDLFRAFMARFAQVLTPQGGRYGVVLPGDAFKIKGNGPVREDLDQRARVVDVQMLTNKGEWVFKEVHPQKPIALVAVELGKQGPDGCDYIFRPEHHREAQFKARNLNDFATRSSKWLRTYSAGLVQPTLPTADAATSVHVIETMMASPLISEHPRLKVRRVYADVETSRKYKAYYNVNGTESDLWPVYGGDSFDVWQPDTGQYYAQARGGPIFKLVQDKRAKSRQGTPYFDTPAKWRSDAKTHPCRHPRIAYRDITNRTNTRTLVTALIPPDRVLTQSAPWVLWTDPKHPITHEAFLLGVMSSIPADWWMRRFVEGHVDEEAFDCLRVPDADPSAGLAAKIVAITGRLASPDDRFEDWAKAVGVKHGPLMPVEKQALIDELDAVVARLYGMTAEQLTHIFNTFHEWSTDVQQQAWNARRDRTVAILRSLP